MQGSFDRLLVLLADTNCDDMSSWSLFVGFSEENGKISSKIAKTLDCVAG